MEHKDSIEYLISNCAFDFRYPSTTPWFSSVGKWGYFYRTLHKSFYNFSGERFGSFPKNISQFLQRKTINLKDNLSDHKYVIHELEMLHCAPHNFEENLRKYILLENYLEELRDGNLYFSIWYGWEGDNFATSNDESKFSYADALNRIYDEFKIPRHKIIFLVSNLIGENSLKEKYNQEFNYWGDNWMEIDVFDRNPPHKRPLTTTFESHLKSITDNYEKPWLRVNRTCNEDRDFLLYDIFKRGIEDKFIFEHRKFELSDEMVEAEYGGNSKKIVKKILERLPLIASKEEQNTLNDNVHDWSNEIIPSDIYLRSPLSFISTTFPYIKEIAFFHGSTFEPILNFQPFVLNSNVNFLEHLKQSGYVTFDNIFDETYDTIVDDTPRRMRVMDEVERISKLTKDEILNLILNSRDRIEHNRNELIKCKSVVNGHIRLANHLLKYE